MFNSVSRSLFRDIVSTVVKHLIPDWDFEGDKVERELPGLLTSLGESFYID